MSNQDKTIDLSRQGEALTTHKSEVIGKKMYIESYGCQMNFSDSEIVASILNDEGFSSTPNLEDADVVFVNTCSIREKAEQTVRNRLKVYQAVKKKQNPKMIVGVLGCMAERLRTNFRTRKTC